MPPPDVIIKTEVIDNKEEENGGGTVGAVSWQNDKLLFNVGHFSVV